MWRPAPAAASSSSSSLVGSVPLSNLSTGSGVRTFGLQLPKSKQNAATTTKLTKPRAFTLDDDDDEEESDPRSHHPLQLESVRAKRYAADAARVLAEDANAFKYDEVYDAEIVSKKAPAASQVNRLGLGSSRLTSQSASPSPAAESSHTHQPQQQSKYITALLQKSAQRKIEQEAVYERNLLKDRKKDDEEHAGKQKFLTSAYKEQLAAQAAARAAQEEQDRRDEAVEQAKRRGGLLGSSLAMAASRAVLDGLAGKHDATNERKQAQHTNVPPNNPSHAIAPLSSSSSTSSSSSSKHPRAAASRHDSDDDDRSSKRARIATDGLDTAPATLPLVNPSPAAHDGHTDTAPASSASVPLSAPTASHATAIAAVANQLTTARNPLTKAEEARARLAARKAAAAGAEASK